MTKALRWDIQALGNRLAKAANAEELSRRSSNRVKSRAAHEVEIRLIVLDIRKLLTRIEDAVPLINLAITTSGASLSTTLPATVSPSRLLQASTFLTAGDTQYSINPTTPVQVGPAFILSLYMLFAGHSHRDDNDTDSMRDTTWKEVIHKARIKLMRIPLQLSLRHPGNISNPKIGDAGRSSTLLLESIEDNHGEEPSVPGDGSANEFAYQLEIVEDLDDDRVHSFEEDEPQPGQYDDVQLAGIREFLPIHQVSKIFYADTSKILNIKNQGEINSPVLLLKRDVNALPPRRMMQENENSKDWYGEPEDFQAAEEVGDDSQNDIDQQIRRESSVPGPNESRQDRVPESEGAWRLPQALDPEWLALEVYTETEDSTSEDEADLHDDSAYVSHRPSSSENEPADANLSAGLANLNLDQTPSLLPSSPPHQVADSTPRRTCLSPKPSQFGPIRSSLSLLEMLIRLTALQQFQQASHLSIPDELLTFFLEESSTTGAGGDGEDRRRTRREARRKVGFDPYDESPVKRRGEDYQYQGQGQDQERYGEYSRGGTPYEDYDQYDEYANPNPQWFKERSITPQGTPEPWSLRSRAIASSPRQSSPSIPPSSPISPYHPPIRKSTRPVDRLQHDRRAVKAGSPLGRGMSVETDSSLGTSPGSPTLVDRIDRGEKI